MPNWERFTKLPFRRGGKKTIATLSGDAKRPILLIGALLREQGFDVTKQYELLFDPEIPAMGLRPSTATNAEPVNMCRSPTRKKNRVRSSRSGPNAARCSGFVTNAAASASRVASSRFGE